MYPKCRLWVCIAGCLSQIFSHPHTCCDVFWVASTEGTFVEMSIRITKRNRENEKGKLCIGERRRRKTFFYFFWFDFICSSFAKETIRQQFDCTHKHTVFLFVCTMTFCGNIILTPYGWNEFLHVYIFVRRCYYYVGRSLLCFIYIKKSLCSICYLT